MLYRVLKAPVDLLYNINKQLENFIGKQLCWSLFLIKLQT